MPPLNVEVVRVAMAKPIDAWEMGGDGDSRHEYGGGVAAGEERERR